MHFCVHSGRVCRSHCPDIARNRGPALHGGLTHRGSGSWSLASRGGSEDGKWGRTQGLLDRGQQGLLQMSVGSKEWAVRSGHQGCSQGKLGDVGEGGGAQPSQAGGVAGSECTCPPWRDKALCPSRVSDTRHGRTHVGVSPWYSEVCAML